MTLPSRRLLVAGLLATLAAFVVLVFPGAVLALLALDLALLLIGLLDRLITPGPGNLEVVRLAPERLSVLSEQAVPLVVRNRGPVALWVRLRDSPPESFAGPANDLAGLVPAQGELRGEYRVTPQTRGLFHWGPVFLRYRSLLRLWEIQKRVEASAPVRVYPNVAALQRYLLLAWANRLDVVGIRRVRLRGGGWEFESLRDYVTGDDTRQLDWKATARRRKLIVRNFEAERNQTVLLLIDSGRLMNATVAGTAKLDHAVNTALVLGHVALARGDRVGLCTFSHKVQVWLPPRGHLAHVRALTEALYDLRGDYTESDHGRCLRFLAARHSKRALLVVLTDFVDAATAADMVAHLEFAGRRHLVLFAALKDPFLDRAARSRPGTPWEAYRKTAALELQHDRREVLERLRQMGVHVLDVEPAAITPPLINQYLSITFRGLL